MPTRWIPAACLLLLVTGCAGTSAIRSGTQGDYGVLVMAHGGSPEWNRGVLDAVEPLRREYEVAVAFGMADAAAIQEGVRDLEARGVRKIGVVRLFVSGRSWYQRTHQILGLEDGGPAPPEGSHPPGNGSHADRGKSAAHAGHHASFWRIETRASFAVSETGLSQAPEMGLVLAERARDLSREAGNEDVLILAHGPGDDAENERWIASIDSLAGAVRDALPFHRVEVRTLREDWPEKRALAEESIRSSVMKTTEEGRRAIVLPFRVHGFGPYAEVLEDLSYASDGRGLIPHENVTAWVKSQVALLQAGPFRTPLER